MKKFWGTKLAILTMAAAPALMADTITYDLNINNVGFAGSIGTVKLDLIGGGIQFTVDLVPNSSIIQQGFGFNGFSNPADGGPTISLVGGLPAGYALANSGVAETGNSADMFGPYGRFEYQISAPNVGSGSALENLIFTVTKSGGFSSVYDLVEGSSHGANPSELFAIHFFNSQLPTGANTGFASTGAQTVVPEPSYVSAIAGLGALAFLLRRKRAAVRA